MVEKFDETSCTYYKSVAEGRVFFLLCLERSSALPVPASRRATKTTPEIQSDQEPNCTDCNKGKTFAKHLLK